MRQRLDDPVFQSGNSTINANSVSTAFSSTSAAANYVSLAAAVQTIAAQLVLMGIIKNQ